MADDKVEYDQGELDVAYRTIREIADGTQFGTFVSDDECKAWAAKLVAAIEGYKKGEVL